MSISKKNLFVNAVNCHVGGGKTLLNGFIKGLVGTSDNVVIFIDKRFQYPEVFPNNIEFVRVSRFKRILVFFEIRKKLKLNDSGLYLGNLPPFIKFQCNDVFLLLSSRFYVENISFQGFSIKDILKIFLEKRYFNIFIRNVSGVIVQTSTMQKLFNKSINKIPVYIWAFDDIGESYKLQTNLNSKESSTFLYVASLMPYKNHYRLLEAWKSLKNEGVEPKLYLTLDQNNSIKKKIIDYVQTHNLNVIFLEKLRREELISYYQKVEFLIFPSYFEAYGLPLIEAKKFNLKIIASDIDYSWDFIIPDGFFNPFNSDSIARAVKRSLNITEQLDKIYTPKEFINKLKII